MFAVATVPAMFVLPAVVSRPPAKVMLSVVSLPRVTVPVFKKLVSPAMLFVVPVIDTLYAPLAATVMPVAAVRLSAKDTVAASVVSVMATVVASTVSLKVVPPLLVIVIVPISVPTASATATTPVVSMVKFDGLPASVPSTASRLMALAIPVPTVKVASSARIASPRSIRPVAEPPILALAVTATAVSASPNVIVLAPVVAAIVPAILRADGAVAVRPPLKVMLSVASLPKVTAPVFRNSVSVDIVPPALIARL